MILDRDTILAISSLISLVLGVVLLAAQVRARIGPWAFCWGAGTAMLGLAGADQALRGIVPDGLLTSSGNVVAISGYVLVVQGARLLADRTPHWKSLALGLALVVLPLAVSHDPAVKAYRVAYNNALLVVCDLWVAIEGFRLARRERLSTGWIVLALFSVTVPFSATRLEVAISTIMGHDTLSQGRVNTWLAALLAVLWSLRGAVPALLIAERSTRDLARLARHDALTGALNRVGMEHWLKRGRGDGVVALLDLDHFKAVNDRYGHARGDAVLEMLVSTIRAHLPRSAACARLGGDEFMLILPGADEISASRVAAVIRADFGAAVGAIVEAAPRPTLSIGLASGRLDPPGLKTLIGVADGLLYQSKQDGRDRVTMRVPAVTCEAAV